MFIETVIGHPYLFLVFVALVVNIPLGYIRENCSRFSLLWIFWIHASIPLIVYLRLTLNACSYFIPVTIFFAILGQLVGSRLRKRQMSVDDVERMNQIPDLNIGNKKVFEGDVSEVMVVLMNMGGPKTQGDIGDFQKRLFSDSLLIRFPLSRILQPLFAWLLITLRGNAIAKRYQVIGGGSPIFKSTQDQVSALKEELHRRKLDLDVTFCFNYSVPLPEDTINTIKSSGKKFILPVSLYPHYSSATTGSSLHYLKEAALNGAAEIQFLDSQPYYLHPNYINAFVARVLESLKPQESLEDFYLVFSAHSLPMYLVKEGDLYPFQIAQTIARILGEFKREVRWVTSYQSAVGPVQWLKPTTEDVIKALARRGIKKILVVPISFVTDHIETLYEIDIICRRLAEDLGIEDFRMVKALECQPAFIAALADNVESCLELRERNFNT